ncbi:isochorismatase family domain-containing protein [Pochonia chlamydosporia 170]|uniref:Isochorismatase family domain-containing protein n=1 Tax=Pochonia chlamydosporia 170 TaxID=1380566 RepID=A0A179FI67_METCM|nr:isochorismatase family domain-containing protein [Pochonia chlamydosporia 170]OAQ64931.1 isochorismatase family domain-containing protein [Pochonia chlamydosporia 170]
MSFIFTHQNAEMQLDKKHTALVFADLQNEFLTETGSYYPMIADKLKELNVMDHIEQLLQCAKENNFFVIHSPHYYYPTDRQWVAPPGAIADYLGKHPKGFVGRKDPVDLEAFVGSGADYPERLKPYLMDGQTANTSPHKGLSCQSNDLIKQLRMRRIEKVIIAGPVGNLCLENHMRDILEAGFEVAVVRDAIAAGKNEEGDGYTAAMVNYRFMANAMWTTEETIRRLKAVGTE